MKLGKLGSKAQTYTHYRMMHGNAYVPAADPITSKTIKPGLFLTLHDDNLGMWFLYPKEVSFETILDLPGMPTAKILNTLNTFWKPETKAKYDQMGLCYKRGILLYGAPGTGKTLSVIKVCEQFINMGGIVIFNPSASALTSLLPQIRDIEPNIKIMVVWEEFDEWKDDSELLSLLDGELQTDNIVYIGTTNFIDKIPARIQNRPSRFAEKIKVEFPTQSDRELYLTAKMPFLSKKEVKEISTKTDGLVIDQIKDIVISTQIFGLSFADALKKVKTYNLYEENEDQDEVADIYQRLEALNNPNKSLSRLLRR